MDGKMNSFLSIRWWEVSFSGTLVIIRFNRKNEKEAKREALALNNTYIVN